MKSLVTNLALIAGLAIPMGGALLATPAHADEGIITERTVVRHDGPYYYHHRYRTVRERHCWWEHHRRVCRIRWVRVYR